MRAIVIHAAREMHVEDRAEPSPGPGEVVVDLAVGGICGSDLHYYNHGGFGAVRLREPMILGHEVSGRIAELGADVKDLAPGDLVAISPSRPCGSCSYCQEGLHNHCLNMRFYGSAMPFPHIQGAFRERLTADATQCVKAGGLTAAEAAVAEPLSVALHATRRAGEMLGRRVLVTGCGPIGALAILAARRAGAAEIVATDINANALATARRIGADRTIDLSQEPDALSAYAAGKGWFHVLYECSGAPSALVSGIATLRPRGIVLQLGLGGDVSVPLTQVTAKELEIRGSFRFHEEFPLAVRLMQAGLIDVKPLISHTFTLDEAERAFFTASDRNVAMKVQIAFAAT